MCWSSFFTLIKIWYNVISDYELEFFLMNICGYFLQSLIIKNHFPNYPKKITKAKQEKKRFPLNSPKILELPHILNSICQLPIFNSHKILKFLRKESGLHQTHSGIWTHIIHIGYLDFLFLTKNTKCFAESFFRWEDPLKRARREARKWDLDFPEFIIPKTVFVGFCTLLLLWRRWHYCIDELVDLWRWVLMMS
jgi:hypothetical protein